jgi:hypothetical protein
MTEHHSAKQLLELSRDHQNKLKEKFQEKNTLSRVEIPIALESKNIVGQTQIIDSNGKNINVFIERVEFLSNYMHKEAGNNREISDFSFVMLTDTGESVGSLSLSIVADPKNDDVYKADPRSEEEKTKLHTLELDLIDTLDGKKYFGDKQKGLGSELYQVAMEISFLQGKHGGLSLRSIRSAAGFHYLQGTRPFPSDQYIPVASSVGKKERKKNPNEVISEDNSDSIYRKKIDANGGVISREDLFQSKVTEAIIIDKIANNRQWSDSNHQGPGAEVPMRMSEYPLITKGEYKTPPKNNYDDDLEDIEIAQKEFEDWVEKHDKLLKSKAYWIL